MRCVGHTCKHMDMLIYKYSVISFFRKMKSVAAADEGQVGK